MKMKYILPPSLDHEVLGYYRPKSLLKLSRKLWLYISKTPKSLKKTLLRQKDVNIPKIR